MTKKVNFSTKPKLVKGDLTAADEWVNSGGQQSQSQVEEPEKVETTRFTIDIPVELHARIKSECAIRRVKMRDEIQSLLEKHFS